MKILVLGAGRMGHGAVFDLIHNSPDVEAVTVADFDLKKAEAVADDGRNRRVSSPADRRCEYRRGRRTDARARFGDLVRQLLVQRLAFESRDRDAVRISAISAATITSSTSSSLSTPRQRPPASTSFPTAASHPEWFRSWRCTARRSSTTSTRSTSASAACRRTRSRRLNYQLVFSVEGLDKRIHRGRSRHSRRQDHRGRVDDRDRELVVRRLSAARGVSDIGGTSTLPDTFLGKINELDYKTIRYAGHCEKFKTMIDLGLCSSEEIVVDFAKGHAAKGLRRAAAKASSGRRPGLCSRPARVCRQKDGETNASLRHRRQAGRSNRHVRDDANDGFPGVDHRPDDGPRRCSVTRCDAAGKSDRSGEVRCGTELERRMRFIETLAVDANHK